MELALQKIKNFAKSEAKKVSPDDLKEELKHALSETEIDRIFPGIPVLTFPELKDIKDLRQLFNNPYKSAIILFLVRDNHSGHWMCLLEHPESKTIEFYDSTGTAPDFQRAWLDIVALHRLHQTQPHLTRLLEKAEQDGYKVEYNGEQVQRDKASIKDCGRHCISRILFRDIPLEKYQELMKLTGLDTDLFSVLMTRDL